MNETHWRRSWRHAALPPQTAPASPIARDGAGEPSTFVRAAVSCLASPASIIAILVLVVNDHILKQTWPSWVTGELSDFAGLYFFPYLCLLAVYGALWLAQLLDSRRRALDPRLTSAIAIGVFGGTFSLFAAVKLSPVTATPALQLLSALAGGRLTAVLDPTDLIALVVLPVGYLAWRGRVARCALERSTSVADGQELKSFFRRAAHTFIIIAAALAVVATSQAFPPPSITDVAADDHYPNVLYAIYSGWDRSELYRSIDGGDSWQKQGASGAKILTDPALKGAFYTISRRGIARSQYAPPETHLIRPPGIDFPMAAQDALPAVHAPGWKPDLIFVGGKDAVARSADGGATWSSSLLRTPGPVIALASARAQVGLLFAATEKELYATRDGGDTWRKVAEFPQPVTALAVHPRNADLLIAGGYTGLQRSLDGGRMWQTHRVATMGDLGVTSLLFVGEQSDTVYAAVPRWGLMRSENAGQSWSEAFRGDVRAVAVTKSRNSKVVFAAGVDGVYRQQAAIRWPWLEEWEPVNNGLPAIRGDLPNQTINLLSWLGVLVAAVVAVHFLAPGARGGFLDRHVWHLLVGFCYLTSFVIVLVDFLDVVTGRSLAGYVVFPALSVVALVALLRCRASWAAWAALAPFELLAVAFIIPALMVSAPALLFPVLGLILLPFFASLYPIARGMSRLARTMLVMSLLLAASAWGWAWVWSFALRRGV